MKLKVAWIGKTKESAIQALTDEYLKRISRYAEVEGVALKDEASLLKLAGRDGKSAQKHTLVLLDSRGKSLSSEEFSALVGDLGDRSVPVVFAIGPANGFSDATRASANSLVSIGKMTLAHELARVVLLEQLYRAFTILKGHPYHLGH